jgi:glutaredoxin 3
MLYNLNKVTIYTANNCPYCVKAQRILELKKIDFVKIDLTNDETKRAILSSQTGRKTVPQIYIGSEHIGGCDDLYALKDSGELDKLIQKHNIR